MGCCNSTNLNNTSSVKKDVIVSTANIHQPLLHNDVMRTAHPNFPHHCTTIQFDTKFNQVKQMLKKHEVDDERLHYICKQFLHIWQHHKCSIVATNARTGKTTILSDPQCIKHKICIITTGTKIYLQHDKESTMWTDRKTSICFKAMVKENLFKGNELIFYRHITEIPLAKYVFNEYNLLIPSEIVYEIAPYLIIDNDVNDNCNYKAAANEIVVKNNYNRQGLYYCNFDSYQIYKNYVNDEVGNICVEFDLKRNHGQVLMKRYYKPIIKEFNDKILFFINSNKFYRVNTHSVIQVLSRGIDVNYKLQFCGHNEENKSCKYHLIAVLTGFNNLNLEKVVNTKQDESDRCIIKSQEFWIRLGYKAPGKDKSNTLAPIIKSFEKDCDFLKKNNIDKINGQRLIDPKKITSFRWPGDFDSLPDQHQEIILEYFGNEADKHLIKSKKQKITAIHQEKSNVTECDEVNLDD